MAIAMFRDLFFCSAIIHIGLLLWWLLFFREALNIYVHVVLQHAKAKAWFFLCLQNQALTVHILASHPWLARIR
ncbi:hypothetical protein [Mariprofundus sp. KV]|uniref:hypothetical protein n=1 Tax=Mariprofundus sp. KV TaxID=2608715 RepID=UPI0015A0A3D7|nr:hypothetical protein [Mariprofundus sp. KV]NWF36115.1 hypothetical protein [Mariprofundus sp. KV]